VDLEMEFQAGVPLRRQLEGALRVAIRSGRLAPGSALPPTRDLADELGVPHGVVVDSYSQLAAEGYLSAKRGSGTRVALLAAPGGPPLPRQAIGGQLSLSERTVEGNVRRIFDKLGLADTPQDNRRVLAVLAFLRA
jgi:DNA-binding transcriptional MocR family regulator